MTLAKDLIISKPTPKINFTDYFKNGSDLLGLDEITK